jgi:hypothetical protein
MTYSKMCKGSSRSIYSKSVSVSAQDTSCVVIHNLQNRRDAALVRRLFSNILLNCGYLSSFTNQDFQRKLILCYCNVRSRPHKTQALLKLTQPGRTRSNVSQLLHNFILIDNRILQSKILLR